MTLKQKNKIKNKKQSKQKTSLQFLGVSFIEWKSTIPLGLCMYLYTPVEHTTADKAGLGLRTCVVSSVCGLSSSSSPYFHTSSDLECCW